MRSSCSGFEEKETYYKMQFLDQNCCQASTNYNKICPEMQMRELSAPNNLSTQRNILRCQISVLVCFSFLVGVVFIFLQEIVLLSYNNISQQSLIVFVPQKRVCLQVVNMVFISQKGIFLEVFVVFWTVLLQLCKYFGLVELKSRSQYNPGP
eukprot:TRINITY_DN4046_c0_g1_i1.p3 TRINITY_DN4046_c0_g1~~TRINITY_DN4046_c0_g1_i1.p3  ORF type:complete len:152 (-),score=4.10 TRINITY_DN4046_c0_g1_i1:178-633(-)